MNSEQPMPDPIDEFLSKGAENESSNELRTAIQITTRAVMRRHRRLRRAVWMSGLVACYAAGILTMELLKTSQREPNMAIATSSDTAAESGSVPSGTAPEGPQLAQLPEAARVLEWQALDSEDRRPDLFRLAGDKYLLANDIQSATRCYRSALQGTSEEELHITVNDNWLFMSLKEAKLEENRYAKLDRP
jgi:hypothetical protein